ncbi:unnamed protein product [Protopolystoma xenopodis]|uniref:Uncharacterized protein n=1 Tax=Protopolystoma xenopodis TaxID=117903 RepID=A0A448WP39_9PLAT|nr:unnamed protein product [Protopolystoma xenopodis]
MQQEMDYVWGIPSQQFDVGSSHDNYGSLLFGASGISSKMQIRDMTMSITLAESNAALREEKKRAALERRRRLMDQMASKQKAFANAHLKDLESAGNSSGSQHERSSSLKHKNQSYECVICQIAEENLEMVLLGVIVESGCK